MTEFNGKEHRKKIKRLENLWANLHELEEMCREYGIEDMLQDNGLKVMQQLVYLNMDFLPGREGNETVVLLSKGEIDSKKVRVEFSLENMDMSGFQKGATYPQIKEYVREHSGLKVSSLYISQVKRKCGLDVGQNYNLSKKENVKQPQCPPEKELAIREAFNYFGML